MYDSGVSSPAGPVRYFLKSGIAPFAIKGKHADPGESDDQGKGPALVCIACQHRITTPGRRIVVSGSHHHSFVNPAGESFAIGCFAAAPGCVADGLPTGAYSWFAGYRWQYSLCGCCRSHLGWFYSSGNGGGFYGLILARLLETDSGE